MPVTTRGGIGARWQGLVEASNVDAAVNVNLEPAAAVRTARAIRLPLVELANIDRPGPASRTIHPFVLPYQDVLGPRISAHDADLWEVVSAGCVTEDHERIWGPTPFGFIRESRPDQLVRASLRGDTLLDRGCRELGEVWAQDRFSPLPAVIWVTHRNSYRDCLAFWNLRALRPLDGYTAPMLLIAAGQIEHWIGFADEFRYHLQRPVDLNPDVILLSLSIASEKLEPLGTALGLQESAGEERYHRSNPSANRSAPFSFAVGKPESISRAVRYHRKYGASVDVEGQFYDGLGTLRFTSPISWNGWGRVIFRLSSPALDVLPKHPRVAETVVPSGDWAGNELRFAADTARHYVRRITLPTLADATQQILRSTSSSYSLSDKGKLGLSMASDAECLLARGAYEVAIALMTPRSSRLVKELKELTKGGRLSDNLAEVAGRWGGRSQRRYLTIDKIAARYPDQERSYLTSAAEALCAAGWAERGLELRCDVCGLASFLPLSETSPRAACPACQAWGLYSTGGRGPEIFYRLNALADRAADQGGLPPLLVIAVLQRQDPRTYLIPGVDLRFSDGTSREIDLFGISVGRLVGGEVKTSAEQFTRDQVVRDVELSARLGADCHIAASVDLMSDEVRQRIISITEQAGMTSLILDAGDLRPLRVN